MSQRTTWAMNLLEHLRQHPEREVTPEEAEAEFGKPSGRQTAAECMENLAKNGQLRRSRTALRVRYRIVAKAPDGRRAPLFEEWGRGAPKVASVFDLARCYG